MPHGCEIESWLSTLASIRALAPRQWQQQNVCGGLETPILWTILFSKTGLKSTRLSELLKMDASIPDDTGTEELKAKKSQMAILCGSRGALLW